LAKEATALEEKDIIVNGGWGIYILASCVFSAKSIAYL
jgi:hypothetical protein